MNIYTFIIQKTEFCLFKDKTDTCYTSYKLKKDNCCVGECVLPSHLAPKISIAESGNISVYGGYLAYFIDNDKEIRMIEEAEEIHSIWFLDEFILLKCDTAIICRKYNDFSIYGEYWHDEIILDFIFKSNNVAIFKDLQDRVFELDICNFSVGYLGLKYKL